MGFLQLIEFSNKSIIFIKIIKKYHKEKLAKDAEVFLEKKKKNVAIQLVVKDKKSLLENEN